MNDNGGWNGIMPFWGLPSLVLIGGGLSIANDKKPSISWGDADHVQEY